MLEDQMDPKLFPMIGEYSNALGRYGPDSPEVASIREKYSDNDQFLKLASGLDRIKRHFDKTPTRI